jgi:hypothetical protein
VLASTLAFSGSASAATLIGNYSNGSNAGYTIDTAQNTVTGFTLPTGSNYNLDDIKLRLFNYTSSLDAPLLQIYADSTKTSTNPNEAALQSVTFTNPTSISTASGDFTFTPTSAFTFLADTRYWLRLSNSTDSFAWTISSSPTTPTGISGITSNGYLFTPDSGSFYGSLPNTTIFQINATEASAATAVPEPTSLPGYIVLLGGLLAGRKIVKSRAATKVDLK